MKDQLFLKYEERFKRFHFNSSVAKVFDNMASRSIPLYRENIALLNDIAAMRLKNDSRIYDLGCSTGNTILALSKTLAKEQKRAHFIGVDSSSDMLLECRKKLKKLKGLSHELIAAPIQDVGINRADLVISNYTLQFIPVADRAQSLEKIYRGLKKGGIFFYSEKVCEENKKRALKNVLIPLSSEKHLVMLKKAGFKSPVMITRWLNFASFMAIK
jgi:tRNA (cmo5U34)-methyltransferase